MAKKEATPSIMSLSRRWMTNQFAALYKQMSELTDFVNSEVRYNNIRCESEMERSKAAVDMLPLMRKRITETEYEYRTIDAFLRETMNRVQASQVQFNSHVIELNDRLDRIEKVHVSILAKLDRIDKKIRRPKG